MTRNSSRAAIAAIAWACLALAGCGRSAHLSFGRGGPDGQRLDPAKAADIQLALGRSLETDGDLERALAAYREASHAAPKRPEPHLRTAIALDRLGRFAEAAPHYEAALRASPGDAGIYCDRGYSLCLQGKDAEGEAALRQAIAIKPDLPRAHNNLGVVLGRGGRAVEALAEFRKAGRPEAEAHLNLAFALGESRRWDEARAQVALARSSATDPGRIGDELAGLEAMLAKAESAGPGKGAALDPSVMTASGTADRAAAVPPRSRPAAPAPALNSPSRTGSRSSGSSPGPG